jgi:uncharacterized membrane protein YciS (DUF1049 family)
MSGSLHLHGHYVLMDPDRTEFRIVLLLAAVLAAVLMLHWLRWLRQKRVKLRVVPAEPVVKRLGDVEQVTASAGE